MAENKSTPTENTGDSANKAMSIVIGLIVLALIAGGAYYFMQSGDSMNGNGEEMSDENLNEPVATVNGEVITRKKFQDRVQEFLNNAAAQGLPTDNEQLIAQVEDQALTALVNTELLLQKAAEAGVSATDEAVNEAYQRAVDNFGGEEGLQEALDELGFTAEELREDIRGQLTIDLYLEQETDFSAITVSDEEVRAYYDEVSATAEDVPSFEEIVDTLRDQLLSQKQQQAILDFIDSVRAEADIEVFVE